MPTLRGEHGDALDENNVIRCRFGACQHPMGEAQLIEGDNHRMTHGIIMYHEGILERATI